jgi:glucosamine-6-phosphate deaminase
MPITVLVTADFDRMSEAAAGIVAKTIGETIRQKKEFVLGLATGNSPTGLYKRLAEAANAGRFDSGRIRSFNLDEYVGLPGENPQQRSMHPQSFCYFMIQAFFGLLQKKFIETSLPYGNLIDQRWLVKELRAHPGDWKESGRRAGRSIVIKPQPASQYLAWIKASILDGYWRKIKRAGGIDLQIVGVGGTGHVAFHESGIPFRGSRVLLIRLDETTVSQAVADGHFPSMREAPRYAVSMGAALVYEARTVVLLANGERKVKPVADSLLGEVTPDVPISYGQVYAERGGELIYVLDKIAARELLARSEELKARDIEIRSV